MAAIVARHIECQTRSATPTPHLTLNTTQFGKPSAIPNKHIPFCSPGPEPAHGLPSPPASPPNKSSSLDTTSILHPPVLHRRINDTPPVYAISPATLAEAVRHLSTQPLPDPSLVFPWLHGLHADNHFQLSFFDAGRRSSRKVPTCVRGLTIVKAGGNLSFSKIKGAIAPEELLLPAETCETAHAESCQGGPCFIDADPRIGFGVRNFHIQACKFATVSDLVVYGDDMTPQSDVVALACLLSRAQRTWTSRMDLRGCEDRYNTFVVTDSFSRIVADYPDLVASDAMGLLNEKMLDFSQQERVEMATLSKASEIDRNVWLGPTPDPVLVGVNGAASRKSQYDILIEATDYAQMPEAQSLANVEKFLGSRRGAVALAQIEVPSSGSVPSHGNAENIEKLINLCRWIYRLANLDTRSSSKPARRFLLHCTDGYTETSLLALVYFMFSQGVPAHEAWVRLHRDKRRNFFAYQADKVLCEHMQARILEASPRRINGRIEQQPAWMKRMDGSLPSRIMPYLYLGNLTHASNPGLLRELGIKRVLSVGEPITWNQDPASCEENITDWPAEHFLYIDKVQDNGVDPLTKEFARCLEFIEKGKAEGHATLVHCRVGVSRSATICIAEVMKEQGLSFPRAYCLVRARRLNVIIQPHLRFAYELLKWEEFQCEKRGKPLQREFEWATIAQEIALMNKPYCRQ